MRSIFFRMLYQALVPHRHHGDWVSTACGAQSWDLLMAQGRVSAKPVDCLSCLVNPAPRVLW